jgi:hypothetical protein
MGVGYLIAWPPSLKALRARFNGRGREGDEDSGSKAGSREALRFTPATGGSWAFPLLGDESMLLNGGGNASSTPLPRLEVA